MQKEVFVLVLALLVAIAGCTGSNNGTATSSSTPFVGGTAGLQVSFVDNAPPREILDNPEPLNKNQVMRFEIAVKLDNLGEQDVSTINIKATIGGIYPPDFDKTSFDLQNVLAITKLPSIVKLDGVRKDPEGEKLPGGTEEMTFKDLGYIKSLAGNNAFPVQADVCYRYATKAVGNFCMRQDMTRATPGVCTVKGAKQIFSSGAPIQVTTLDESVGGRNKVILKFKIKAVGTGSFFKPDTAGAAGAPNCAKGDFSSENFVQVSVNSGVNGLTCSGFSPTSSQSATGQVRLANGEASVTCIQDGVTVDALQNVNVQVDYNHLVSASTSILVKHLPADSQQINSAPVTGPCTGGTTTYCTTAQNCPGTRTCISGSWDTTPATCIDNFPNDNCPPTGATGGITLEGCSSPAFLSTNAYYNAYKAVCDMIPSGSTQSNQWTTKAGGYGCCYCISPTAVWVDLTTGCSNTAITTTGSCSSPTFSNTDPNFESYRTVCRSSDPIAGWRVIGSTGCCVCSSGKVWGSTTTGCVASSTTTTLSGCSSSQIPKTEQIYNTWIVNCQSGPFGYKGTWYDPPTSTVGCCICPSNSKWSGSNNGCVAV